MADRIVLPRERFGALLQALRDEGYQLVGPTVRDGAIVCAEITGLEDLPAGWTDVQEAGTYRLQRRTDDALFGYALGPQSWKQFLFVPQLRLWQAQRQETGFTIDTDSPPPPRLALIGARACELHAIAIQDRIFLRGTFADPDYAGRSADMFILAVNCAQAGGTCFCVSMRTGPRVTAGYDLAVTEILDGPHRFLIEVGSERGAAVLAHVEGEPAMQADTAAAARIIDHTARSMGRRLDTTDIQKLLDRNYEHLRWEQVAARCLSCANCTLVCPTCFCSTVTDVTDLTGTHAERWRRWDSCFTSAFSYIHGGSVRATTRSRYRQWLTHKLATWIDQFGTSGCVGCGRCITWCPVGIDLTDEVAALRARKASAPSTKEGEHGDA
jgi:sulfhydrogenase subunit beta (sulfur reductase)